MKEKVIYIATKLLVVVVLFVALVVNAFGKNHPSVTVTPYANERAFISVENVLNTTAELTIEDKDGYTVFYREGNIGAEGIRKVFEFDNLADGAYRVTLKHDRHIEKVFFVVENSKVTVEKKGSNIEPFFDMTDNVLRLSLFNFDGAEIKMTLANNEGVLLDKTLGNQFNISEGLNLDQLAAGDYALIVTNGETSYSYKFKK